MFLFSLFLFLFTGCQMPDPNKSSRKDLKPATEAIKNDLPELGAAPAKFQSPSGNINLSGSVNNTAFNEKYVKLFETEGRDFFLLDSSLVSSGKFAFELQKAETGLYKIGMEADANKLADIVLNPGEPNVDFTFNTSSFRSGPSATTSKETQAWREYLPIKAACDRDIDAIRKSTNKSDAKRTAIYQREQKLRADQLALAAIHPGTYVANIMNHAQSANRFDKNLYWNDMDFSDVSLIHSAVYPDRIEDYMRIHASQQKAENERLLGFYNAVDLIAQKIKDNGNDRVLEFALYTMSEGFYSSGMEDLSMYVVDNYFYGDACGDAEISELFKMKAAGIRNLKVGNTPPDFTLSNDSGKSVNFNAIAGSKAYTLVLFWASFCHKCEREIPEIKTIYNQYKSKGFEILAVSVDTDKAAWQGGLQTHGMAWPNVTDLQGWRSPVAKDFRVTSTPVMFLVNKNREIVAKPKNAQELAAFLKSAKY